MKYLKEEHMRDADSGEDMQESAYLLEARLAELRQHRAEVQDRNSSAYVDLLLEESRLLIRLEKLDEAWDAAHAAFDAYLGQENWQGAVEACDVLYAADRPGSLAALGQGIWLAVTFPVDPELTVAMLEHVVEETPDDSDGAAVAAVTAHYVADLRTEGKRRGSGVLYQQPARHGGAPPQPGAKPGGLRLLGKKAGAARSAAVFAAPAQCRGCAGAG
jgi:hypothetical protein